MIKTDENFSAKTSENTQKTQVRQGQNVTLPLNKEEKKLKSDLKSDTFIRQGVAKSVKKNGFMQKTSAVLAAIAVVIGVLSPKTSSEESSENVIIEEKAADKETSNENSEKFDKIIEEVEKEIIKAEQEAAKKAREVKDGTFLGALSGKEKYFNETCEKYDVEPKFAAAIMGKETTWGLYGVAVSNNPFSYRASGDLGADERGFGIFSTPELGIEAGIRNLARYREDYGIERIDIDHVYEIGQYYCSEDYENWVSNVQEFYNELK